MLPTEYKVFNVFIDGQSGGEGNDIEINHPRGGLVGRENILGQTICAEGRFTENLKAVSMQLLISRLCCSDNSRVIIRE